MTEEQIAKLIDIVLNQGEEELESYMKKEKE